MNQPRNLAASVRQRLLNLAQAQKEDFNLVLTRYGIERLLYRLERSAAGFGDIVTPAAQLMSLPALLSDLPAPQLYAYNRETVIAEKFEAMVLLGIGNTRMKDFYDLWYLSQHFTFEGNLFCSAIAATFERRRTPLPTHTPLALTSEFTNDEVKQRQWLAFVRKGKLNDESLVLSQIGALLHDFLIPPTIAICQGVRFDRVWSSDLDWYPK